MSKKASSWVNNITTWFQTMRNQDQNITTQQNTNQPSAAQTEQLARRVLDIMNKPKGLEEDSIANPTTKHKR